MSDIFTPTGTGNFSAEPCQRAIADAASAWQAHLDAGRLKPRKPAAPHIRARHAHNHRVLGLPPPRA